MGAGRATPDVWIATALSGLTDTDSVVCARSLVGMSASDDRTAVRPNVEEANAAIRRFVQAHGARPWDAQDLAELDRLRAVWQQAVQERMTQAA